VYEPITVEIDRGHGEGDYRSYTRSFIGRLVRIVEAGHTTMSSTSGQTGVDCSTWSTSRRINQGGLPDAPSTRSSTPIPPGPHRRRDTPQRTVLGVRGVRQRTRSSRTR
jgi:hypothetical protein